MFALKIMSPLSEPPRPTRAHLSKNCPHYKPIIAFHSRHTAWARFPFDGERRKKWHRLVLWEEEVVEDQD